MRATQKSGELNRTGIALAPELAAELIEATRGTTPSAEGDASLLARTRISYAEEKRPQGTMPPPGKAAAKPVAGQNTAVFLDKLGERLAFERSGVRLYDALLSKLDAFGSWEGGPSRGDLEHIRQEEHEHFLMVRRALQTLGGDPTAVTPSANVHAVASKGLAAVLADPRMTLRDSLEAILVAELVDNDCWENLVDLAAALGQDELAQAFTGALEQEREHLTNVRQWLGVALSRQATGEVGPLVQGRAQARKEAMETRASERQARQTRSKATTRRPRAKTTRRQPSKRASSAKRAKSSRS